MSIRAKQMAKKILAESNSKAPVDVEALAKTHGIPVEQQAYDDEVSGMLVVKDGKAIISINKKHSDNRKRFSIAHELGHYFLHKNLANVFVDKSIVFLRDKKASDGTQLQEIEANVFAAELLMPESDLRAKVKKNPLDLENPKDFKKLESIAKKFKVSSQALTIRLTRLGLVTA